jgi:hypothetical protein
MKNRLLTILLVGITTSTFSQVTHDSIVERASSILSDTIGQKVLKFLDLHPGSYYEYKTRKGYTKKQTLNKNRKLRESMIGEINVLFAVYDTSLTKRGVHLEIWVKLDSNLNLLEFVNLNEIPEAYIQGTNPVWLPIDQLKNAIDTLPFRESNYPICKSFNYSDKHQYYYWYISKTLWRDPLFDKHEFFKLNAFTGEIMDHDVALITN